MARTRRHVRKNRGSKKSKSVTRPRRRKTRKGGKSRVHFKIARDAGNKAAAAVGHAGVLGKHAAEQLGVVARHGYRGVTELF